MNSAVSAIIPVYNAEKTLRRCVESLVYGVERKIKVILVDDCSQDNSWKLCQELQEEFDNVKCIQNEQNQGVSYTRNHGIAEADGDWIMFVDSDDWVSCKFISTLLKIAEKQKDSLVICGFHYIDELTHNKTEYTWNPNTKKQIIEIQGEKLFDGIDRIMLQNVWNKIFRREIIKKNNIKFDETQSMGEDFQFVLDYMQAANIQKCAIVNEALYYYVRANELSLMSNFGWASNEKEIERLNLLSRLCGEGPAISNRLYKEIARTKENRVYHVVRTKNKSKEEKINRIEEIYQDGCSKQYYREQNRVWKKEKLLDSISYIKYFEQRIQGKLQRIKRSQVIRKTKKLLQNEQFSIISQNCIGGVFYHDMEMQFLSPTINLYFKSIDFVRFVTNLQKYLSMKIEMEWGEEYPIGKLDDITIYFMHYNSCTEAENSWNKRKDRVNFNKIIVLSTDMEGFNDVVFEQWKKIIYPKILFTAHKEYVHGKDQVYFPKYVKFKHVPDLIPNREFYKNNVLIETVNRVKEQING